MHRLVVVALFAMTACKGAPGATAAATRRDPHSYAVPERVVVRHLSLDLAVDFDAKTLTGTAALTLARVTRSAKDVVLDTNGLSIASVAECRSAKPLSFTLGAAQKLLGQPLTVALGSEDCIKVAYHTSPEALALLWVDPAGTSGKQHPMLFTQSQAILARTWIPLQDSPAVRFTYDATIRVPPGQWALMSAENPTALVPGGVWTFKMEQAIPSYLMALAVGDFAFRPIGPRSGVYAEPSVVNAAAAEFAEVEDMMTAAEQLYGPYRWGRYDMLVLPPSFPYGGMENPRLTFLTPTVITGDRGLVSLIAHELAHSWSGNLVTNSTWNDFWLNEGFTTYVERRIMEQLRGAAVSDVLWVLGGQDLDKFVAEAGPNARSTRLALDYGAGDDPDDMGSDVAYEKGAVFLRQLELACGRDKFDQFLRQRFDRRAFQSTDSRAFELEARAELIAKGCPFTTKQLAHWLHEPGLPADVKRASSPRIAALQQAARTFAKVSSIDADDILPPGDAPTLEWVAFLRALPADIDPAKLVDLDQRYRAAWARNAEILMHWYPIVIRSGAPSLDSAIEEFLLHVGRRRMVMPVYEAMMTTKDARWRKIAADTFERAKSLYHPITRDSVAKLLGGP
ncbi:MAG: M1 family metallopeptidase [Kofleriaceae bacterium]